jgi:hypothetical protein
VVARALGRTNECSVMCLAGDVCERFMTATKLLLIRLANDASGTVVRRLTDVPQEALEDELLPNCKTRECQQERCLQLFRNPIRGKIINTRRRYNTVIKEDISYEQNHA